MNHHDLTLAVVGWAGLDFRTVDEEVLSRLQEQLAEIVAIDSKKIPYPVTTGGPGRMGLGFVKFREQRFFSVKLGNLARDRLGTAGLGGALITSGIGVNALIAAGTLSSWGGAAALIAIGPALVGRGKPLTASFGLDEATTLDMAWRYASVEHGFRLVAVDVLKDHLGEVEPIYRNAGFSAAKLDNALRRLETIGMIKAAGTGRYQLIERITVTGTDELAIDAG